MIAFDTAEIRTFWRDACMAKGIDAGTPHQARTFSDPRLSQKTDEIGALARAGGKRATAHLALDFERNAIPRRAVGDYWLILDAGGRPLCLVRITKVATTPFEAVDAAFAASEGEGDLSLEYWRTVHSRYFRNQCESWGVSWREDMVVVCESFELVHPG